MQRAKSTTAKISENAPAGVGGRRNADETCPPADKGGRYMAGVTDAESGFMLASETYTASENLQTHDAAGMFRRAVRTAKAVPGVLASHTLSGFARGFKNAISGREKCRRKGQKTVRIRTASVRNRHVNNSHFGCQNGTVRNRIKTVPGFNSENPALLFLFTIHYKFVRHHMGLNGKTPAEAMGIRADGGDERATLLAFAPAC